MADRTPAPDTPELRARWGGFAWTPENKKIADWHIAKYPEVTCPDTSDLYPNEQRNLGLEGAVRFKLGIDEQGKLVSLKIVERAGHGFDEAASKAMRLCKFKPALSNDGRPVPAVISWTYRFELGQ